MVVHAGGLAALLVFYVAILVIGVAAYWVKGRKKHEDEKGAETITVARRDIGWVIGGFTMTATWCGGGFINGTAEILFTKGLVYAQPPIGNALSLVIGGLFFAEPMRSKKYMTMLDPFEQKYGKQVSALMYLPAFISEVFWIGAIMAALGSSVSVVMELEFRVAVSISVAFCVLYVVIGGIYSVTWTDMAELIFVVFGLILCVPFIWHNPNVHLFRADLLNSSGELIRNANLSNGIAGTHGSPITNSSDQSSFDYDWLGRVEPRTLPAYIDAFLGCIFGGIPWQDYFQRVLSAKSARRARILSFVGALGCVLVGIPAAMIGIAARYTDWTAVGYDAAEAARRSVTILPLALEYLTPKAVAFFGVGAVSAAVMSSADASLLSIGAMFAHNVYKPLIRPRATETELVWTLRASIILGGFLAACLAIFVESVVALWLFACDLVYVVLFPQLVCVLFIRWTNAYGAIGGFTAGIVLRMLAGEPALNMPPITKYPFFDQETGEQQFPFRTFAMLINFLVTLAMSRICHRLIEKRRRRIYVVDRSNELEVHKF